MNQLDGEALPASSFVALGLTSDGARVIVGQFHGLLPQVVLGRCPQPLHSLMAEAVALCLARPWACFRLQSLPAAFF